MAWQSADFITRKDVGIAFRKAKVDLYYENGHPNLIQLSKYEQNLERNLERLYVKLTENDLKSWMTDESFIGTWSIISKSWKNQPNKKSMPVLRHSDSIKAWRANGKGKPTLDFRLVGRHSIDMHVVGALWMHKVGRIYDAALRPEAYGSRLRTTDPRVPESARKFYGELSLGSFRPYFEPFRQWRDNGLIAIRKGLDEDRRLVAITADVRQFYHRLGAGFLLHPQYINLLGIKSQLGHDQIEFTQALIAAIYAWAASTPFHQQHPQQGLPVGFPAARLIANVALAELDQVMATNVSQVYYGRYVDDILMVLEDREGIEDHHQVWDMLIKASRGLLSRSNSGEEESIVLTRPYLEDSDIQLVGEKQKTFLLEGDSGKDLINCIERHIRARSSEWRSLPVIPEANNDFASQIVAAWDKDGEEVDNLRKADALSARRATFAMHVRDAEAFAQDLPPKSWKDHRERFFKAVATHILTLPQLVDYETYIPRLLGLAIACNDFTAATSLLERLEFLIDIIERECKVTLLGQEAKENLLSKWRQHLSLSLFEACVASLQFQERSPELKIKKLFEKIDALSRELNIGMVEPEPLLRMAARLHFQDLGRRPFRYKYFPFGAKETFVTEGGRRPLRHSNNIKQFIHPDARPGIRKFLKMNAEDSSVQTAFAFPTRPFTLSEIHLVIPSLFDEAHRGDLDDCMIAFRGTGFRNPPPSKKGDTITIPHKGDENTSLRIGLTSWHTSLDSWRAAIVQQPDPDTQRYSRMNNLLNDILSCPKRPDYLVLPELALPPQWFFRIAKKLMSRGISLISGIEYLHSKSGNVANQVWASLVTEFPGYRTFVTYCQDKQRPAVHEETELTTLGGVKLKPWTRYKKVPLIRHGELAFAILVCSELTDVRHRSRLRGKVDAVFVPEWNQDTETFSSLVEAASGDVHAFVVQCNHRDYGDTRIRAPAKEQWKRDLIRVKGGVVDYFVIGEIDFIALRKFQSHSRSPTGTTSSSSLYKPVPDGFIISSHREVLPG